MQKKRRFFSIRKKIFFSIALTSAAVLLISTVISYFYFRDVLKKQVLTDQLRLANTCSGRIETMLNEVNRVSYYLASDQAIANLLMDTEILPSYAASRLNVLTSRYVQTPLSTSPVSLQFIFFLSDDYSLSDYLASTRTIDIYSTNIFKDGTLSILSERDYQKSDWYQQSSNLDGSLYSFSSGSSSDTVYFSRVVRNIYLPQNAMGTLVLGMQKTQLSAIMNESVVYPTSQIYLTYKGTVLCTAGQALDLSRLSEEEALASLPASDSFQTIAIGPTSYYGIRHDLGSGYSLTYLSPVSEI